MTTRAEIQAEIQNMQQQHEDALKAAEQAIGAISALQWVLSKLPEDEPEKELENIDD